MKVIQPIIVFIYAITSTNACVILDATYSAQNGAITGTLTDDGKQTCTLSGTVDQDPYPLTCIEGYSSSIRQDVTAIEYNDHGHLLSIPVEKHIYQPGRPSLLYRLSARESC